MATTFSMRACQNSFKLKVPHRSFKYASETPVYPNKHWKKSGHIWHFPTVCSFFTDYFKNVFNIFLQRRLEFSFSVTYFSITINRPCYLMVRTFFDEMYRELFQLLQTRFNLMPIHFPDPKCILSHFSVIVVIWKWITPKACVH